MTGVHPSRRGRCSYLIATALAVGAPTSAAAATALLWPWSQPDVSLLFFPATLLAAVYGGYVAGIAAAMLSVLLATYFYVPPVNSFAVSVDDATRMVIFLIAAVVTASLVAARTRAEAGGRQAIADLHLALDQVSELSEDLERRVADRTSALETANKALQAEIIARARLSERLVQVQEAERRDLARELHDQVGQMLTGLKLTLEAISRGRVTGPEAAASALELVESLMSQIREISLDLRPSILDDLGLVPALLWHVDRYTAQTGVTVTFSHAGLDDRLPGDIETAAFRIVQEALTNVARHAAVKEAAVWVRQDRGELCVIVEDAGQGFDADALSGGRSSGMTGMRERAALLGGALSVHTSPGGGTQVTAVFPVGVGAAGESV